MKARIIKSTGSWYMAQLESKKVVKSRLRGVFKNESLKLTNPIAVGDWVNVEPEESGEGYIIDQIHTRNNLFVRKSSRKTGHDHIIASNIDQAILFATLKSPRTSLGFIDRFLICAESYRIPAIIVFNKSDLYKDKDLEKFQVYKSYYEEIGYKCLLTSTVTSEGLEEFKDLIEGKLSLIAGHSGAGKSTIINYYNPDLNLRTKQISKHSKKGQHTTTHAEMFEIFDNSFVIDSPGIKEVGITGLEKEELRHQFPEMREYLNQCRFDNCLHLEEPQCAVMEALEQEKIADWRYLSYITILDELKK